MPSTAVRSRYWVLWLLFVSVVCATPCVSTVDFVAVQILDHFMTEVGQRFSTRTEERLLAVVYTLQQRTYKTGLPAAAAVPEAFKKELAGAPP